MSKTIKIIIFTIIATTSFVLLSWLFYENEVKFMMPTPVPLGFEDVEIGTVVDFDEYIPDQEGKLVFLHFFNRKCPCSKFNATEFSRLIDLYKDSISFYVIVQGDSEDEIEKFNSKYKLNVPCILDQKGDISELFGIYSTPQAVIMDKDHKIFYKGNYNKARFCTQKKTAFAERALHHLLKEEPLPKFNVLAGTPYGCELPSNEE